MDDDPINESRSRMSGYLTLTLTVAARVMEVHMHRRATRAREEALRSREAAQEASNRARAEASALRSHLRLVGVGKDQWWNTVTPEKLAITYAAARAHGKIDGELAGTAAYLDEQIKQRFGMNADELVAGIELRERERRQLAEQQAAAERAETARQAAHAADPADSRHWSPWQKEQVAAGNVTVTEDGTVLPPTEAARAQAERAAAERTAREQVDAALLVGDADLADVAAAMQAEWERFANQVRPGGGEAGDQPSMADDARELGSVSLDPASVTPPATQTVTVWDENTRRAAVIERINKAAMSPGAKESRVILDGLHGKPVTALTAPVKNKKPARTVKGTGHGKERARHR